MMPSKAHGFMSEFEGGEDLVGEEGAEPGAAAATTGQANQ